jgi:hypothetical protein
MSFQFHIAAPTVPVQLQQPSASVNAKERSFELFLDKHPGYLQYAQDEIRRLCSKLLCKNMVLERYLDHKSSCANMRMQLGLKREAERRARLTPAQRLAEDAQRKADAEASRIRTGALRDGAMDIVMKTSNHDGLCNSVSRDSA